MKRPLGINLPIRQGTSGYFDQSFDVAQVSKNNLLMLLNTKKGERRMNPEYGSSLWEYLFENISDASTDIIEDIVRKDVAKWIPEIIIQSVDISQKNENFNIYTINLVVSYYTNQFDKNVQVLNFDLTVKSPL